MSHSSVFGQLGHSVLELRRAEFRTSVSQPEGHLQEIMIELFPENHDIVKHSACQVQDKGP
jgi:hypothetical protein